MKVKSDHRSKFSNLSNVWLHSSVGRASHRYRGGHGFESRWSPDFFQASSIQLLKLENSLRWSFFTLIYTFSSDIRIISYILRINTFILSLQTKNFVQRGSSFQKETNRKKQRDRRYFHGSLSSFHLISRNHIICKSLLINSPFHS